MITIFENIKAWGHRIPFSRLEEMSGDQSVYTISGR